MTPSTAEYIGAMAGGAKPKRLSRYDLIAAGANFSLVSVDGKTTWKVECNPAQFEAMIYETSGTSEYAHQSFRSQFSFEAARLRLVNFILEQVENGDRCDGGLARRLDRKRIVGALATSWKPQLETGWPSPVSAAKQGLSLHALLYSAIEKRSRMPAQAYLRAGADPLVSTYDGDCAARLGVAAGLIDIFNRPEWFNACHAGTGETGLFQLARGKQFEMIVKAMHLGADPDILNERSETILDLCTAMADRQVLERAISEVRAKRLQAYTLVLSDVSNTLSSGVRRL